jgi:biopolymer transport protein ExbD
MAGAAGEDDEGIISGINVTPLVDVTLVLLIIFWSRPRSSSRKACRWICQERPAARTSDRVSVELTVDGKTLVDSKAIANEEDIGRLAKDAKAKNKELRAVIRADKKVEHGRVIHVLDLLKRSGVAKIAFAVSPLEGVPIDTGKAP